MLLAGCGDDGGEGGGDESSGAEFTLDHTRQQQAELGMDTPGLNAATDDLEEQIQATFEAADRDKTCENPDEIADMMGSLVPSGPPGSEWIAEDVSRFLDEWCP